MLRACPHCGAQIADTGDAFCSECRQSLMVESPVAVEEPPSVPGQITAESPAILGYQSGLDLPRINPRKIIDPLCVATLSILLAVGFAVIFTGFRGLREVRGTLLGIGIAVGIVTAFCLVVLPRGFAWLAFAAAFGIGLTGTVILDQDLYEAAARDYRKDYNLRMNWVIFELNTETTMALYDKNVLIPSTGSKGLMAFATRMDNAIPFSFSFGLATLPALSGWLLRRSLTPAPPRRRF